MAVLVDREGLGDALLKLPFLRALAQGFPGAEIWWIARHQTAMAGALRRFMPKELHEAREHVGISGARAEARRQLETLPPFSLVFDMRTKIENVWLARRHLSWERFLCCLPGYLFSSARPPGRLFRPRHIGERALSLAAAALQAPAKAAGRLIATEPARNLAAGLLPDGPAYVGLALGSREGRKNWPADRFIALATRLAEKGIRPVILLGPQERDIVSKVAQTVPQAMQVDFAQLADEGDRLDRAIAVAERLALVVANDSGLGHLCGAVGRPIVSLFGPTDARRWAPFAPLRRVLRAQDYGGQEMERIPLAAVLRAVEETLAASGQSAPIPERAP
jgi:ADP-heptose:LPS heptosyltransferase